VSSPVPKGPLAVRWHGIELPRFRAGVVSTAVATLENAGTSAWRSTEEGGIRLAYHWLDDRGNPIVWDGIRTLLPEPVPPGATVELPLRIRGALPAGRYRLAVDLVYEGRLWLSEIGNAWWPADVDVEPRIPRALAARGGDLEALAAQEEPLVPEDEAAAIAYLADGVAPLPDWSRRVLDAHEQGYALVGGSVAARRRLGLARRPSALAPWAPGGGRVPGFPHPLLCPSVVRDFEPTWTDPVEGLPAVLPPDDPHYGEPWLYDARIAVTLRG